MDKAQSEADLRREGYELREGEIEPNVHRGGFVLGSRAGMIPSDGKPILAFAAPGETSSLALERSLLSWPAPFSLAVTLLSGPPTTWLPHLYYRFSWEMPPGATPDGFALQAKDPIRPPGSACEIALITDAGGGPMNGRKGGISTRSCGRGRTTGIGSVRGHSRGCGATARTRRFRSFQ